jgi:ferredoxin-type protein NapF
MMDKNKRRWLSAFSSKPSSTRLPWLKNSELFFDDCTRCGQCRTACPQKIITIGDGGFPAVDFTLDECTFCYQCASACPESLFTSKESVPWQQQADISPACLALQNVECRSCHESCESMAITFHLEIGKVAQPTIIAEDCNGCGACISICPTEAMTVIHRPLKRESVDVNK